MNAHCHRLIFNKSRGQIMAVSESASGHDSEEGQRPGRGKMRFRVRRGVVSALTLLFGLQSIAPAWAQIVADPAAPKNQQAVILNTANGLPQVNIQTPSAAGVSRNTYSQFDVGRQGVILNNARTSTQTQQGGWVQGNPYLATGSARVILNEVNSSNPSQLRGYLEVAGERAQIIVANPAGIVCDGCGPINATRFTLTTGTPILNNGNLDGYLVRGGRIAIEGLGLDATRADYTDLIARAVAVNAGLWAQTLHVSTGANQVDAAHTQVTPVAGEGAAPGFAIDVAALGGMYAGKIRLIGTEAGLGVRNAGQIGTSAGEIVLTVDGQLTNTGTLSSATTLAITSRGLDNAGTLAAQSNLALASQGSVSNSGVINAAQETRLTVAGQLANSGTLTGQRLDLSADSLMNTGTIQQTGLQALTVTAQNLTNTATGLIGHERTGTPSVTGGGRTSTTDTPGAPSTSSSNGSIVATASTPVLLADGRIALRDDLFNSGTLTGNGTISLAASGLANQGTLNLERFTFSGPRFNNAGGKLSVSDLQITAASVDNTAGQIGITNQFALTASDLINRQGSLQHAGGGDLAIALTGTLDNTGGLIASNATNLTLAANLGDNTGGRIEHAGTGTFTLNAGQWQGTGGQLIADNRLNARFGQAILDQAHTSARQIDLGADTLSHRGGTLVQSGTAQGKLNVTHAFDNTDGIISGTGPLQVSAATLDNTRGRIISQDTLTVAARENALTNDQGTLVAGTALTASAATTLANRGGQIQNAGSGALTLGAQALDNTRGQIAGNGDTLVSAPLLNNNSGTLSAIGALQLEAATQLDNTGGTLASGQALTLNAGTVDNTQGQIAAQTDLTLHAATLANTRGRIVADQGTLSVATTGATRNDSGLLQAAQAVTLSNAGLTNGIAAGQPQGGLISGAVVAIDTHGQAASNTDGTLQSTGKLTLRTGALDNDGGLILSGGKLAIDTAAQHLSNRNAAQHTGGNGGIFAQGALDIASGDLDNSDGRLGSQQQLTIAAAQLANTRGAVLNAGSGPLTLSATDLANTDGTVQGNGTVALTISHVTNAGGQIAAQGDLTLKAPAQLDNRSGRIATSQALDLTAGELKNVDGEITALGALQATVASGIDNTRGLIAAKKNLVLAAASLDNTAGQTASSGGNLTVTTTGATRNTQGKLLAAQNLTLATVGLDNSQGTIYANTLQVDTHGQALANTGGTLAASTGVRLDSGALTNDGGLIQSGTALAIDTHGQTLSNRNAASHASGAGGLAAGGALTVTGADLDNTTGYIGAQGPLTLTAHNGSGSAVLTNTGGTILGTATGSLTADRLDNSNGQIQTIGDLNVAAGQLDNTQGLLRSAATLDLHAQSIGNRQTQGSNQGLEGRNVQLATTALDNTGGAIRADQDATLASGGTLDNTLGLIAAGRTLSLHDAQAVKTLAVLNSGGTLYAGQQLTVGADRLGGDGNLLAPQNLDLTLNRDFINSGKVQAGNDARIATQGTVHNSGQLLAGRILSLSAANLDNTASGEISATLTQLAVSGTLTNRGLIDGSETAIDAGVLNNIGTGRIYGDHIGIAAGTLNNRSENGISATIAARDRLDIGAGQVNNDPGALLFAGGDLAIGGSLDANRRATGRAGSVTNNGGTLQALGALSITAHRLDNLNPDFQATLVPQGSPIAQTRYSTSQGMIAPEQIGWMIDYTAGSAAYAGLGSAYGVKNWTNGNRMLIVQKGNRYADPVYAGDYGLQVYTSNTNTGLPICNLSPELCVGIPEVLTPPSPADPVWARYGIAPPTLALASLAEPQAPQAACTDVCSEPTPPGKPPPPLTPPSRPPLTRCAPRSRHPPKSPSTASSRPPPSRKPPRCSPARRGRSSPVPA